MRLNFIWLCFLFLSFSQPGIATAQRISPKLIEQDYIFERAEFEACHASTIVRLDKHRLMSAWFGGQYEGSPDVSVWAAVKDSMGWTKPIKVADGMTNGKQYPCWNPVLFKAGTKLYLHYKAGPNPREWWALYKISSDDGKTWSEAIKLPAGFLGPIKNKPVLLENGNILYPSSTESIDEKTWKMHVEISDRNLNNWRKVEMDCDTFQVIQPSILFHKDRLQILARSKENKIVQSWSDKKGEKWSKVTATSLPNPNSGSDAVTLKSGVHLLVYNPLTAGKEWWDGRSVLKLAASYDGINWKDIYTLEDEKKGEYSYPAIISDDNDRIHITYTDQRKRIAYRQFSL